jgi:hypothetical protein
VVTGLLVGMRERGLETTRPILVVINGAKARRRAVTDVFDHPVIQRLKLHKLRNVADRLPDALASAVPRRMRAAYHLRDPLVAQAELEALARKLDRSHPGAAPPGISCSAPAPLLFRFGDGRPTPHPFLRTYCSVGLPALDSCIACMLCRCATDRPEFNSAVS